MVMSLADTAACWSHNLYLDVTGFYNHYHDLFSEDIIGQPAIETTPLPVHILLPADFGNGLLGYTKGVELAPEWRPTNSWRLRGSYSYLHMNLGRSPNSLDIAVPLHFTVGSSPRSIKPPFNPHSMLSEEASVRSYLPVCQRAPPANIPAESRLNSCEPTRPETPASAGGSLARWTCRW